MLSHRPSAFGVVDLHLQVVEAVANGGRVRRSADSAVESVARLVRCSSRSDAESDDACRICRAAGGFPCAHLFSHPIRLRPLDLPAILPGLKAGIPLQDAMPATRMFRPVLLLRAGSLSRVRRTRCPPRLRHRGAIVPNVPCASAVLLPLLRRAHEAVVDARRRSLVVRTGSGAFPPAAVLSRCSVRQWSFSLWEICDPRFVRPARSWLGPLVRFLSGRPRSSSAASPGALGRCPGRPVRCSFHRAGGPSLLRYFQRAPFGVVSPLPDSDRLTSSRAATGLPARPCRLPVSLIRPP